jgi:transcriptional regulator with XRE-family HTH domain
VLQTKQSVVSRWERGLDVPRVDTLARILHACGFEADLAFRRLDDVDRSQITAALPMLKVIIVFSTVRSESP